MATIIKLTPRNKDLLEAIFSSAPKTYEEALLKGKTPPIPVGKKYAEFKKEEQIINSLFENHTENKCSCMDKDNCLFERYINKNITREELIEILM